MHVLITPEVTSDLSSFISIAPYEAGSVSIVNAMEVALNSETVLEVAGAGIPYSHVVGLGTEVLERPERSRSPDVRVLEALSSSLMNSVALVEQFAAATGRPIEIDMSLSGAWLEHQISPQNARVHRDADEGGIVRAIASPIRTRYLLGNYAIPFDDSGPSRFMGPTILDEAWDRHCYPIGTSDGLVIMTGQSYHRAPNTQERLDDMLSLLRTNPTMSRPLQAHPGIIARPFISIWGRC